MIKITTETNAKGLIIDIWQSEFNYREAFSLVLCPGHRKIGREAIHGLTKKLTNGPSGGHEPECPSKTGPGSPELSILRC